MNQYLAFPVKVDFEKKAVTTPPSKTSRAITVEHQNTDSALADAANRIPLSVGESIAIVLIKKAST